MKKITILTLIFLVTLTFFFRFAILQKKSEGFTFDEFVYATLAREISENPTNYNTQKIYEEAAKAGRNINPYFKKPLFKHPPLFASLIALSHRIFGESYVSAAVVSLFFGVLLIPLAYLLGSALFDKRIGIYSAILMSFEPVSWICSQKIWPETTLAFFSILSLYFFVRAIKKYKATFMVLSGISAGFAALTKYPGFLPIFAIFVYALCRERRLFKKKSFILSLFIPFMMLGPWLYWNYAVYGPKFISEVFTVFSFAKHLNRPIQIIPVAILLLSIFIFFTYLKKRAFLAVFIPVFILVLFFILRKNIMNSLYFYHVPHTGWLPDMFIGEGWHFYIGRLIELSPFYILSFLGLFLFIAESGRFNEYFFLYLASFAILTFFIFWKNYQSRYILSAIIPLVVLSAASQAYILKGINKIPVRKALRIMIGALAGLAILFALSKTLYVDFVLAVPNLTCYF